MLSSLPTGLTAALGKMGTYEDTANTSHLRDAQQSAPETGRQGFPLLPILRLQSGTETYARASPGRQGEPQRTEQSVQATQQVDGWQGVRMESQGGKSE